MGFLIIQRSFSASGATIVNVSKIWQYLSIYFAFVHINTFFLTLCRHEDKMGIGNCTFADASLVRMKHSCSSNPDDDSIDLAVGYIDVTWCLALLVMSLQPSCLIQSLDVPSEILVILCNQYQIWTQLINLHVSFSQFVAPISIKSPIPYFAK